MRLASGRRRLALTFGAVGAYLVGFVLLEGSFGQAFAIFGILPISVAGWLFGKWTGISTAILFLPLNLLLFTVFADATRADWVAQGGGLGSLGLVIVGLVTGWLGEQQSRTRHELLLRTESEMALKENRETLQTVVSSAPIVLWAVASNGEFTLFEGKGLKGIGLEPGQVVGRSIFEVSWDIPNIREDVRRALSGGRVHFCC